MKTGLKTLNLLDMIQSDPEYFRTLLTPSGKLTCEDLYKVFVPTLNEQLQDGSLSEKERESLQHMERFLEELTVAQNEGGDSSESNTIPSEMLMKDFPEKMLHFTTSLLNIPCHMGLVVTVEFLEEGTDDLPESSTCGNTLRIPTGVAYNEFRKRLVTAVTFGYVGTDQS
ncbi:Hypp9737 [Branchiostoma lanceolatum]|uniref:Hypp9737 protein n=1 Tax=Branchiostoma lanceolatum TaxID=7740 RepID=A0A8S4MP49_BRALA|nr:Hypp9737 [Branchiostoma lanceolatum]